MKLKLFKNGFTLAETLITLTILGVIAVLVVPGLIRKQQVKINKTKLKKVMTVYDANIQEMVAMSNIKTKTAFKNWAESDSCKNALEFFKPVVPSINGCSFMTSDGVWWDLSSIDRTLVAFKKENLVDSKAKDYDDYDAFILVTSFDTYNAALRIDDLAYEAVNNTNNSHKYVEKLYFYLGLIKERLNTFELCKKQGKTTCIIKVGGKDITYNLNTVNSYKKNYFCPYDRELQVNNCNKRPEIEEEEIWVSEYLGVISSDEATSEENCASSVYSDCLTKGDYQEAARRKCNELGARLPGIAELESMCYSGNFPVASAWLWADEERTANWGLVVKDSYCNAPGDTGKNGHYGFICVNDY